MGKKKPGTVPPVVSWLRPSPAKWWSVSAEEKVLVALVAFCFTEAIRLFVHGLLPVMVKWLLAF